MVSGNEHSLGKGEVLSSILSGSTNFLNKSKDERCRTRQLSAEPNANTRVSTVEFSWTNLNLF